MRSARDGMMVLVLVAALPACTGEEPVLRPGGGGDAGAEADPADGAAPTVPPDGGPEAARFCQGRNARVCTDFEPSSSVDEASSVWDWEVALPTSEVTGGGDVPFVTTGPPGRGDVLVTRLSSTGKGFSASRRSHINDAPGWAEGVAARAFEVKVYVAAASADSATFLNWDGGGDAVSATLLALSCAGDACTVSASRYGEEVADIGVRLPMKTWVKLVVDIPPSSGEAPNTFTVSVQDLDPPAPPSGRTVKFEARVKAPTGLRVDVGLSSEAAGEWELRYDDFAARY